MTFVWPPKKRSFDVNIVFPVSNMNVIPDLRLKTLYIGDLARTLAIYRVSNIYLFVDPDSTIEDANFIRLILEYLLIPPYLRKKLVPIVPELRFAGLLHPLNIATHNPEGKEPRVDDLREGIIVELIEEKRAKVFIGYRRLCLTELKTTKSVNDRILVRILRKAPLICEEVMRNEISEYIGYNVAIIRKSGLCRLLGELRGVFLIPSKYGESYVKLSLRRALAKHALEYGGLNIFLGNPEKDFDEIVKIDFSSYGRPTYKVNFIPYQGTLSIRTLEALNAILAILNIDLESFSKATQELLVT